MALIDDFIAEFDSMPRGAEDAADAAGRVFVAFNDEVSFNTRVDIENKNWPAVAAWLRGVKDRREHAIALAEASAPKQSIEQNVMVDVSLAMSQAYTALDALELPEDEVKDAKLALSEAQNEQDPEKRSGKVFEVAKWAVENGPKAVDAVSKVIGLLGQIPPLPM